MSRGRGQVDKPAYCGTERIITVASYSGAGRQRKSKRMSLDGLTFDGAGGVVDDCPAASLGVSESTMRAWESEIAVVLDDDTTDSRELRFKIANIFVTHLNHDERMCALHTFYGAKVATCSGEKLCRMKRRVLRKLKALPEAELKALWHLLLP